VSVEQRRRNVRVLHLLDESARAFSRGDREAAQRAMDAANEVDASAVSVITGGMRIGEVPRPEADPDGWSDYIAANEEGLARAEAEEEASK
jgi:hypothetical protein